MLDTRIILSGLWAATMLTFLWGDVLGLIAGYMTPGKLGEKEYDPNHNIWVGIAALMLLPILMIVLNLALDSRAMRWVNIILAIFWILFNLGSLSGYPRYNKFLLAVTIVFNGMTIWYAWNWVV